jgi:NAD(P)-dependent dehydrogenase (short-subunit alcohol dehydrogenase family)
MEGAISSFPIPSARYASRSYHHVVLLCITGLESWGFHARVAVVTGGNKGIGLEVCRQLAGNGVTVVLTARDETRGAAAAEKLGELGLSGVIFHQLDITDASSIARLADFLKIRFGRLDILVSLLPKVCYGRSAW